MVDRHERLTDQLFFARAPGLDICFDSIDSFLAGELKLPVLGLLVLNYKWLLRTLGTLGLSGSWFGAFEASHDHGKDG